MSTNTVHKYRHSGRGCEHAWKGSVPQESIPQEGSVPWEGFDGEVSALPSPNTLTRRYVTVTKFIQNPNKSRLIYSGSTDTMLSQPFNKKGDGPNHPNRRRRPAWLDLPAVVFSGNDLDSVPRNQLRRSFNAFLPEFKYGGHWSPVSSGGWKFSHRNALMLLDMDLPREFPRLFVGNGDFVVKKYEAPCVAFCYAPKRVYNGDLSEEVQGLFKSKTVRKGNRLWLRKCMFSSRLALTRALRDGVQIAGFSVEFHMPYRKACTICLSFDHTTLDCHAEQEICRRCCSDQHTTDECKEKELYCCHCYGTHFSTECWKMKKQCQIDDEDELLSTIRSYKDLVEDVGEDEPVELPWKQKRRCRENNIDEVEYANRSGAELVRSKKKSYAEVLKKKKKKNSNKPRKSKKANQNAKKKKTPAKRHKPRKQRMEANHDSGIELRDLIDDFREELRELKALKEMLCMVTSRVIKIEQAIGIEANAMDIDGKLAIQDQLDNLQDHVHYIEQQIDPESEDEDEEQYLPAEQLVEQWEEENKESEMCFDKMYACGDCNERFVTEENFKEHRCRLRKCPQCSFQTNSPKEAQAHITYYHRETNCMWCKQKFEGFHNAQAHAQKDHRNEFESYCAAYGSAVAKQ